MSQNTSDPTRIERDLDQTRSRLGSHLSELQDKFSPGQVLDDLMGYFRGSEGAEVGRSLLENVRGNPMPAAVTAIGLAWLMASNPRAGAAGGTAPSSDWKSFRRSSGPHLYGSEDYGATMLRVRNAEQTVSRYPNEDEHGYSARLDDARGQAIGLARHVQESTASFGQRIRDALAAAEQAITGTAGSLRDQAGNALGAAGGAAGSMSASAQDMARDAWQSTAGALSQGSKTAGQASGNLMAALADSPVLLGAIGLAAGALLGALLPQSEQEEAALGGIAGQARDSATSLAKEGLDRGKQLTQTVMDKGRDSVQALGLTGKSPGELVDAALSGDLAGSAKAVVQDVLATGDEAVRKEVASAGTGQPTPSPGSTTPS